MGPIDAPTNGAEDQGLIATPAKTAEDEEADLIYNAIEERLKKKRTTKQQQPEQAVESERLVQVADLKPELERVSMEEWAALPEATDFRIKRLKRLGNYQDPMAKDRFVPLPDNLLTGGSIGYALQAEGFQEDDDKNDDEDKEDKEDKEGEDRLLKAGEAREAALGLALDSVEKTLGKAGSTVYTSNNSYSTSSSSNDPDKARSILKKLLRTNPHVPSAYLAAARLEHSQGRLKLARHFLAQGCEHCPDDGDLWIEAIRMSADKMQTVQKALESDAARLHDSLWLECLQYHRKTAASLQHFIQTALEAIPASIRLWEEYLRVVDAEDRESVLEAALQCVASFAMALELGGLSLQKGEVDRAMSLCNEAAKLTTNAAEQFQLDIFICEVKERLEQDIVLNDTSVVELRAEWLIRAEKRGSFNTCKLILLQKDTFELLAEFFKHGAWYCASLILLHKDIALIHALKLSAPFAEYLLKQQNVTEAQKAVIYDAWYQQDPSIATQAFQQHSASEGMWLDHLKSQPYNAQAFETARSAYPNSLPIVVLQAQMLLKSDPSAAEEFLCRALEQYPKCADLWLMQCDIKSNVSKKDEMATFLKQAVEKCTDSAHLWIRYAQTMPTVHRVRATLDIGRRKVSSNRSEHLCLLQHCMQFERDNGNELALKALQQQLDQLLNRRM